jgi:hypothetical protein
MKAAAVVWKPPPDTRKRAAQGGNPGGPRNPEPGGTGKMDSTPTGFPWQRGLSLELITAVVVHRQCRPLDPLPPPLQRQIGRAWREHGGGAR